MFLFGQMGTFQSVARLHSPSFFNFRFNNFNPSISVSITEGREKNSD